MPGLDPGVHDRLTSPVVTRAGRDANLNSRCRNCKNPPRTRSNSAAAGSSNRVYPLSPDEEHANANVREIGFSRRRLCAGPRRRPAGASRRHGLSRGASRTRIPGAAARLLRAAAGRAGLLSTASAARRVWLSAASARRIRHLRRAALRRRAGTVLRAVLARLRTALCLWLRTLARLSALVRMPSVHRLLLIRHARPRAGHPRLT